MSNKKELINSDAFEQALAEGAECKKEMITTFKTQNKSNFQRFNEVMLSASPKIQSILDMKKKHRSAADVEQLNKFKQTVRMMYGQTQNLLMKEDVEDGKKTKAQKIVDRLIPVIDMLRYIDNDILEKELNARGYSLKATESLVEKFPGLALEDKKNIILDIFNNASSIRQKVKDDNEYINSTIFQTKVPTDLQFDKNSNNTGLKQGDFRKLVDLKTKLVMAKSKEAADKVDEKIQKAATDKQFEMARAELVRDKLTTLQ